jgi:hypothetical protein
MYLWFVRLNYRLGGGGEAGACLRFAARGREGIYRRPRCLRSEAEVRI